MMNVINATLPVDTGNGLYLDLKEGKDFGATLASRYILAEPYPHIVIDNFLPTEFINMLLTNFPKESLSGDYIHEGGYAGHHKRQIFPNDCNEFSRKAFDFFNSAPFLQFLEGLTSIDGIISDPYFAGGGFHEISRGGKLGIHADFRVNNKLHLSRRLNVLIYLNKDWKGEYGGELEIWDRGMKSKVKSIAPLLNRCVIFNTDADSYHGHPDPLNTPHEVKRRSLALYYYTASRKIYEDLPAYSTMYAARPADGAEVRRQVMALNAVNYKKDWVPPALSSPKLLLPPAIYRKIKTALNWVKARKEPKA